MNNKIDKRNFEFIIKEIERMEKYGDNIWVSVGLLELLFSDDAGRIDEYFHTPVNERDLEKLVNIFY